MFAYGSLTSYIKNIFKFFKCGLDDQIFKGSLECSELASDHSVNPVVVPRIKVVLPNTDTRLFLFLELQAGCGTQT